ncbi:dolichyl-diphosphooligosaccharide--protein glycosyltransferase subunit 1, partial [Ascosphaera aggregata]
MRFLYKATLLLGSLLPLSLAADAFRNINLSRTINLHKSYPRETITAHIENISQKDQHEYLVTFASCLADKIGSLQVRDTTNGQILDIVPDTANEGSYVARLSSPLPPSSQLSLAITYSLLHSLQPLPRAIEQDDPQFLTFSFGKYIHTPYHTSTQQTIVRFPPGEKIASYSPGSLKGSTLTYGPYNDISATAAGTEEAPQKDTNGNDDDDDDIDLYTVRYENTTPLTTVPLLKRTLLISHVGNTISTEDAYTSLTNEAANLTASFSRVAWTLQSYHQLTSSALKELNILAGKGAGNAWFVDDVGNVSTSTFGRSGSVSNNNNNNNDGKLDVRPRYPVFGGWRYSFRVGWENTLERFFTTTGTKGGNNNEYTLSLPLVQLPRNKQGITVDNLDLKIILPEGADILSWDITTAAKNKKQKTAVIPAKSSITATQMKEKSFLDTTGRSVLRLQLRNLVDEVNGTEVVVQYRLGWFDEVVRKPAVVAT